MPVIKPDQGIIPSFGKNCFIAENATITGQVITGDDCSFWFNSVVRGDVNTIVMGNKVNVQDGAIIHCTYKKCGTVIGNNVSIGHNAIVHGCTLKDNILVGMGAIIMDNSIANSGCIIAAGAVVLENSILESGWIYTGIPAKKMKALEEDQYKFLIKGIAENYVMYSQWYK